MIVAGLYRENAIKFDNRGLNCLCPNYILIIYHVTRTYNTKSICITSFQNVIFVLFIKNTKLLYFNISI